MRFRFIGDPRHDGDGPQRLTQFGYTFDRVNWTEVVDPEIERRLRGNTHYEAEPMQTDPPAAPVRRHMTGR